MKKRSTLFVILTVVLLSSCASSSSPSFPLPQIPEPESKTPTVNPPALTSWRITPSSQFYSYSSTRTTVISQTDAAVVRRDSLTSRVLYSIGVTRGTDSSFFSGSVVGFDVQGPVTESEVMPLKLPISFTGKITNHSISIQVSDGIRTEGSTPCDNISRTPLNTIQHNVVFIPLEIINGQPWTDSTSSIVCTGSLPISLTMIRTSRVIGEADFEGTSVLVIDQNERTLSKGEGSQGQHRIFVESDGITTGRVYVDRNSGQLLTAKLTNQTILSVRSSGRNQRFSESSTETTQRIR